MLLVLQLDQGGDILGEGVVTLDAGYRDWRVGHLNTEVAVDHVAGIRTVTATPSAAT